MVTRITALVVLVGLWTCMPSRQVEASTVHVNRKLSAPTTGAHHGQTRTYIVHMDRSFTLGMHTLETPLSRYSQLLQTMKQDTTDGQVPIHVYSSVCHGFSARLTSQEAAALRQTSGVLAVYPDTIRSPHTTRTPAFLNLNSANGLWPDSHFGEDVIVGLLDTGVWPERASFNDAGFGPAPARWKGTCELSKDFNASACNNKLIGARFFVAGYEAATGMALNETVESRSPRDTEGHGTHTTSTAAGVAVPGASLFGFANGTASGMAPKARVAVYKICWALGCVDSDILAAFDHAVADGVDVISLSVGGPARDYSVDSIAIGAFGAMEKGVFVAASAGNAGPELQTVENNAPWITTVAASTIDRIFPANVILGNNNNNNQIILGQSLYSGKPLPNATELITGAAATSGNVTASILCLPDSLSPALAQGKILLCERGINARVEKGAVVLAAGGAGMILYNTGADEGVLADPHLLPATMVGEQEGTAILAYITNNTTPVASFQFLATQYNVKAPLIASFSSRGPNSVTPQILKPDVTAPGVDIIAAWTGAAGPTDLAFDERRVGFNIISGTSMSCPHVSGIGALLRGAHPEWSPAAIKSAIMTTATIRDDSQVDVITDQYGLVAATPFQFGAGHVRPEVALDPGLVYDMGFQDYVDFLCASNYSADAIQVFTTSHNESVVCPPSPIRVEDLNYPSFAAIFEQPPSLVAVSVNMTRTVTNVGNGNATYAAQIVRPADTQISVFPEVLSFSAVNEKKTFTLQVTTVNAPSATLFNVSLTEFGYLVWTDGIHAVQSPISITVYK